MAAPITKLRIGLQPDTPEEHTRLLINVNSEAAQTALQIATDLRVRANPPTAKIYYYNFDGSELLYTETIEPGGNGSWDGEPGRASTAQYEFIFNGWSTEPDQVDPTEDATAGVYSSRRVYAAYKRRDIRGFITFESDVSFGIMNYRTQKTWDGELFVSTDRENWTVWGGEIVFAAFNADPRGYFIYMKGSNNTKIIGQGRRNGFAFSSGNSRVSISGNLLAILDSAKVVSGQDPEMADYCFAYLFADMKGRLLSAPELPATNLSTGCYSNMFNGCASLTKAPELPATTLAASCYDSMFYLCAALTTPPELPATTLAASCYDSMFQDCSALTTPPELPATTLASSCYNNMFRNCAALTTPPELPATTLASSCYHNMFRNCVALTTPPELPATTLALNCYWVMFAGCKGLTSIPELPAKAFEVGCYQMMFQSCTGIRVSESQDAEYSIPFMIPSGGGGGSPASQSLADMFGDTGGIFTGTPVINTIYYLAPPAST